MTKGHPVSDYVKIGFEKIECDLRFFIECLGEVLGELGLSDLASHLPWFGSDPAKFDVTQAPPQLGLVYSIAFQILNMVEENAATYVRGIREREGGVTAERGLWGERFAKLKEAGIPETVISDTLARVRVEPVL